MSKEFKLKTEFIPYFGGPGIGIDKSSQYKGIVIILPFLSISILMKIKDPLAL